MSLNPTWRIRIWAAAATVVALVLGYQIAVGNLVGSAVVGLVVLALIGYRYQPANLQLMVVAVLFAGYLIGNRGFAQVMPSPAFPLLPAEAGLAGLFILQALERMAGGAAPRRLGAWDYLIGAWIVYGCARMLFDGRVHGMVAIRDFAMVYYAAFFFLAANLAHRRSMQVDRLLQIIRIASSLMAGIYLFTRISPGVLESMVIWRGVPLIFYKDDLVGVFAALGAVLHFIQYERAKRSLSVAWCLVLVGVVLYTNNRSAMLALAVGALGLLFAGRWRLSALLGTGGVVGAVFIVAIATWRGDTWRDTPLMGVYDRVVSLTDPFGEREYGGEITGNKGDNNLFRMVWWQEVVGETVEVSPVFGLGFGYDLSSRFLREYYADNIQGFSARSPHSIIVTVFGRMGVVGVTVYLAIILMLANRVWTCAGLQDLETLAPLLGAAMVFTSACFGVVLEGPMGAVVFWSLMGLGAGMLGAKSEAEPDATAVVHFDHEREAVPS